MKLSMAKQYSAVNCFQQKQKFLSHGAVYEFERRRIITEETAMARTNNIEVPMYHVVK